MSSYPHSFPLRLTTDLSNTLHSASLSTGITKSDLIRVALNKFLVELSQSGITEAIAKIKGSWYELSCWSSSQYSFWEGVIWVLFLTRRLQYLTADYNDEYSAGFIRNKLKDVSSTRKLITSLSVLDKHHRDDPRDY